MDSRNIILMVLVVAGCAETGTDATTRQELQASETLVLPQPVADGAAANARERELKRAAADKRPRGPNVDPIDWDEAGKFKQLEPTLLPVEQRAHLANIAVPVLAFDDPGLLADAFVTQNRNWYFLAADGPNGLNINIRGTRNSWTVDDLEISEAGLKAAENYTITRTDAVLTVSWRAFGAAYSLDIECAKPFDDKRCTEDEFALTTIEQLGVLGGQP